MRKMLVGALMAAALGTGSAVAQTASDDPYIWLEDVSSPKAMAWVEAHNAKSTAVLESDPRYQQYYNEALTLAQAQDRIPYGNFTHGQIYNFWQDADHTRGILRRTTRASYESGQPKWTTVLDLDALAKAENANWVFKGMTCARPAERRCLISLSDGGEDAVTIREFDLPTGKFVKGGFELPKGKQDATWLDENTLLISREWHKGELSRTGYPYILKRLKRGQPLSAAVEAFRGKPDDGGYGVGAYVLRDGQNRTLPLISRPLDTWHTETYLLTPKGVRRVAIPEKNSLVDMVDGRVVSSLDEDWKPSPGKNFTAGSIVSHNLAQLKADTAHPKPALICAPGPKEALEGGSATKSILVVTTLDNVRRRTLLFTPTANGKW